MKILYNNIEYELNDVYSEKDMTGWDLSDRTDMDNSVIHGLCLAHESPNNHSLPPELTGVTFVACNLDNVVIPAGNEMIDCSNRKFCQQNDGEDWLVDPHDLKPIEPLHKEIFIELGLSTKPQDIPENPLPMPITFTERLKKEQV